MTDHHHHAITKHNILVPSAVALGAIIVYSLQSIDVMRSRHKHNIKAPAITGNEEFERVYRAHVNTSEHIISFLPSVYLFSIFISEKWAGIIGGAWILGRILYHLGYKKDAGKRGIGFRISFIAQNILLLGASFPIAKKLFHCCHKK